MAPTKIPFPEGLTSFTLKALVMVAIFLAGQWAAAAGKNERLAAVETEVKNVKQSYSDDLKRIEGKLDNLITMHLKEK